MVTISKTIKYEFENEATAKAFLESKDTTSATTTKPSLLGAAVNLAATAYVAYVGFEIGCRIGNWIREKLSKK